jgi:DnaJ family protein A protein 2
MTFKLSLLEALCGFKREILYLDGNKHLIQNSKGDVVGPNHVKTIMYMGLPIFNNPAVNGNLFIHFEIEFPNKLNDDQLVQFQSILKDKPKELSKE